MWDGLFGRNPPIREFTNLDPAPPQEIWVVRINPVASAQEPADFTGGSGSEIKTALMSDQPWLLCAQFVAPVSGSRRSLPPRAVSDTLLARVKACAFVLTPLGVSHQPPRTLRI